MEIMVNNILTDEKFDNRIKEEFKKIEDFQREGILARIGEQEDVLTTLMNEYKEKVEIRQKENSEDLEKSKNEVEEKVIRITDTNFPSLSSQINSMELSTKEYEIKGAQRYEALEQRLEEMREQLKQLKQRQANNSNT